MDIYQTVTDKIVAMIEAGAGAWHMPWHGDGLTLPRNPLSGTRYRGCNVPLLWSAAMAKGYQSHQWATFKQWQKAGAQVRKGERSELVFFWKRFGPAEGDEGAGDGDGRSGRARYMARAYNVFAVEQVDEYGVQPSLPLDGLAEGNRIAVAEGYFSSIGATVRHGGGKAFYAPSHDAIQMPEFRQFFDAVSYYATLGHEHVHWTGHAARCNREFGKRFGDRAYAFEELVAELGAAFLCAGLGLANAPRPDHAAYLDSWLKVMREDKRAVFTAGARAQAAVDWLDKAAAAGAVSARIAA